MPASTPDAPQLAEAALALDVGRVRAISIDLDDTLWPIWPTIAKAEQVLLHWLTFARTGHRQAVCQHRGAARHTQPDGGLAARPGTRLLSALRLESIRLALQQAGDEPALAEPAFDVFLTSASGELFDDAHDTLAFLSARYPVVAVSNGNADVHRVGIGHYFRPASAPRDFGVPKPDVRIFMQRPRQPRCSPTKCCMWATTPQRTPRARWRLVCRPCG